MIQELRKLIKALVNESSSRPDSGPGIVLSRWGGLSPIRTTGGPESRGLYAFIHGKVEPFLAGSTDPEGISSGTGRPSRYALGRVSRRPAGDRDPSLALRYFRYDGPIYTHFNLHDEEPAGEGQVGDWYLTTARELREYVFGKKFVDDFKASAATFNDDTAAAGRPRKRFLPVSSKGSFSKDDFEVFIPARGGKFLPYEKDPRREAEFGEELPDRRTRLPMKAKLDRDDQNAEREAERKNSKYLSSTQATRSFGPDWAEKARIEGEELRALWDRGRDRGRYADFENFEEFAAWMREKKLDAKLRRDEYQASILNKTEKLKK